MGLEPAELARWTRFAAKGGIGKCTATCDCVAESPDDLMFLKDDEIIVLLQLQDKQGYYLGYCEGVVGRFSGSDVLFHSKLKKPVMTKRTSTNTTLSVHSISNIPYSPTPTTPTTPTGMENPALRSSRKMVDELLAAKGGGRSPSQNSIGQVSPSNSTTGSPIPGSVRPASSNIGARNVSQETRKAGALQQGSTSPREFHLGFTVTDDTPEEDSGSESHTSQSGVTVDETSTPTFLSTLSNRISSSTPPTVSPLPALELLQSSFLPEKEASLRPSGSLVNDHDPTTPTAPLRIIKRPSSNPTSPSRSLFSPATTGSPSGSPKASTSLLDQSFDSSVISTSVFDDASLLELGTSSEVDRREQDSTLPSFDSTVTAESAYDDLAASDPGRFSRFSLGGPLTIPQLLGMTSQNTSQPTSANNEFQANSVTNSPPPTIPSKLDGRASLTIAARGKVDEATLASTQAQVGIGLSLLQDLVGGMSSDSDSDYGYSDEEAFTEEAKVVGRQADRTSKAADNGNLNGFLRSASSTRSSVTPREGGIVRSSMFADEEASQISTNKKKVNHESHRSDSTSLNSPTSPTSRSPPTTPVRYQSPRSLSRSTRHQQSPDSFTLPDGLDSGRERRPSLATSVVSGVSSGLSRKSGASGSWYGDIYDNYRYSTVSVGSSMTGVRRPSIDFVKPRSDSISVAGRMRLESIGFIQDVAEEAESADLPGVENQASRSVDADASLYSQDSSLSALSKEITSLASSDSIFKESQTSNRPSPLSIAALDENANLSPLLHTDWASPTSTAASTVQTALPPPTASVYSPHLRENSISGLPIMEESVLSQVGDGETQEAEELATASSLRKRLESESRSHTPNEAKQVSETEVIEPNDSQISFSSAGLGQGIVVDDDDELPSRILANGDDGEYYDNDETSLESGGNGVTGSLADSPEPKRVESKVNQDETQPGHETPSPRTSFGCLAPLFVSNRTPSPAMLITEDDGNSSSLTPSSLSQPHSVQSPPGRKSPPSPPSELSEPKTSPLRPRNNNNNIGQERRSLFLPHPNAPKAPANAPINLEPGAGVGVIPRSYPTFPHDNPSGDSLPFVPPSQLRTPVQTVIRMALSTPLRTTVLGPGRSPVQVLPTIYGRTEVDLANSVGPVPIVFSIDPPLVNAVEGKATAPGGAILPAIGGSNSNGSAVARGADHPNSSLKRPSTTQALLSIGPSFSGSPGTVPRSTSSSVPQLSSLPSDGKGKTTISSPVAQKAETTNDTTNLKTAPAKGLLPIPRPNFTPKSPGPRPRSRSFSGFNSTRSPATPPLPGGEKHEPINNWSKRAVSSSALAVSGLKRLAKPSRPSPLSGSSINSADDLSQPPSSPVILGSVPSSPLARNMFIPSSAPPPSPSKTMAASSSPGPIPLSTRASRSTLTGTPQPATTDGPAATLRTSDMAVNHQTVPTSIIGKPSFESVTRQAPVITGIGVARQSSLRSKLSLPNLRRNRTRDDDTVGVYDLDANERSDRPKEMMQVKDTEFELVRPSISLLQAQQRTSEESVVGLPEHSADFRVDSGVLLRSESPSVSLNSSVYRSPILETRNSVNGPGLNLDTVLGQSNEGIEAHRQREAKWISLMSSSPASLSRKSKKVKKLLIDGVPSSVRYLIWSYLTDGKGRAVKGVYERLSQRGEVAHTRNIIADVDRLFGGDSGSDGMQYLQATKGAIIVLLQAYFSMVPDVQYMTGLTKIVGQLLLLAPEEDAFWIFTTIMDTHIRPYFTVPTPTPSSASTPIPRSTQMEVDAALYSRALETIDPSMAKKIFVDLGILPGIICHSWFTSLFVGTLPPDYVNRVWDIFLYEGIPFLLRVALSLTIICRKFILTSTKNGESTLLATLARPPPQWLPPTPDAFLSLAFGVKLKDDDIRKQRIKMGEQVKRQTQAQQVLSTVTTSGISLPRV